MEVLGQALQDLRWWRLGGVSNGEEGKSKKRNVDAAIYGFLRIVGEDLKLIHLTVGQIYGGQKSSMIVITL